MVGPGKRRLLITVENVTSDWLTEKAEDGRIGRVVDNLVNRFKDGGKLDYALYKKLSDAINEVAKVNKEL